MMKMFVYYPLLTESWSYTGMHSHCIIWPVKRGQCNPMYAAHEYTLQDLPLATLNVVAIHARILDRIPVPVNNSTTRHVNHPGIAVNDHLMIKHEGRPSVRLRFGVQ